MSTKKNMIISIIFFIIGCGSDVHNNQDSITVTENSEPYFYQQWYLAINNVFYDENNIDYNASIHAENILEKYRGRGIKIAVIDDGIDLLHNDLKDSIVHSYDIQTKTDDVSHTYINNYHGTAVTGIISARKNGLGIQGVASESQIIFLKYKSQMSDSETIELFNKAVEFDADIINCSWGTRDVSESVKDVIQEIAKTGRDGKGMVIVFASGNNNEEMINDESSIPEVIAVGSSDENNVRAPYSNYGSNLDLIAPGGYEIGITTLDPIGENGISIQDENYLLYNDDYTFRGTSASAPIVSGVIALMLEKNFFLTREEIEKYLQINSDKIGDIPYEVGRNDYYGYGKINVNKLFGDEL